MIGRLIPRLLALLGFLIILAPSLSHADPAPGPQYFDYQLQLPLPPADSASALTTLDLREQAVLSAIACGNELNFAEDGVTYNAGEDSTARVLGKIDWGAGHAGADGNHRVTDSCRFSVTLRWADFDNQQVCSLLQDPGFCGPDQSAQQSRIDLTADTIWLGLLSGKLDAFKTNILSKFFPDYDFALDRNDRACLVSPDGVKPFAGFSIVNWRRLDPLSDTDPAVLNPGRAGTIQIDFAISQTCLLLQANQSLMKLVIPVKDGQQEVAGTDGGPCHLFGKVYGDWDMAERNLIRIAYLIKNYGLDGDGQILHDGYTNLRNHLLTLDKGLEGDSHNIVFGCGNSAGDTGDAETRATDRADSGKSRDKALGDLGWFLLMLLFLLALATLLVGLAVALGILAAATTGAVLVIVAAVLLIANIPETENHLLGINTTKYLNNQLILHDLGNDLTLTAPYISDQIALKQWLLNRMQQYLQKDFIEYNARPYQRHAIESIRNIFDFAGDPGRPDIPDNDLRNAAHLVLDYTAAKFAVGNSQSRRIVPYRRHRSDFAQVVDADASSWNGLLDVANSADHQIGLGLLYSGQTQQLPLGQASRAFAAEVVNAATSAYIPEATILDLAIAKDVPIYQRIHHETEEIYSSGHGFLISAGGLATGLAYPVTGIVFIDGLFSSIGDWGSGVPTTLFLGAPTGPDLGFLGDPPLPTDDQPTKDQRGIFTAQQMLEGPGRAPPLSHQTSQDSSVNGIYARYLDEMIPGSALRSTIGELIRIKGEYQVDYDNSSTPPTKEPTYDNNLCVWDGFACGTNIEVGPLATNCSPVNAPPWIFIDTGNCLVRNWLGPAAAKPAPFKSMAPRTLIALFEKDCPADQKCTNYGFYEVIDAAQYATISGAAPGEDLFAKFRNQIAGDNAALASMPAGPNMVSDYQSARGQKIEFSCWGHESGDDYWGVFHVNGIPTHKLGDWPFAGGEWSSSGALLRPEVQTPMTASGGGLVQVTSPRLPASSDPTKPRVLTLDFSDRDHPKAPAEN